MRWPFVIEQMKSKLDNHPDLANVKILRKRAGLRPNYPSAVWRILDTTVGENTEVVIVTWEIWAKGVDQGQAIEAVLLNQMHADKIQEIDGVRFWMSFVGGADIDFETEMGIFARSLDFRFELVRTGQGQA